MGEGVEVGVVDYDDIPVYHAMRVSTGVASATTKNLNTDGSVTANATASGAVPLFLDKMVNWEFCPPSNNLWTVDIKLHSSGNSASVHSLSALYNNIRRALSRFKNTYATKFAVNVDDAKVRKYISLLQQEKLNIFLANMVSLSSYSLNVEDNVAPSLTSHGGFITAGKSISGRNHAMQCNIQFIQSNYEIGDILFEQWIAALAAQGLVQDPELPELRADIFLYNYAASHPEHPNTSTWVLRKTISIYKAFPTSRGGFKASYEPGEAGVFRNDQITFKFSDYSIDYHL